MQTYSDLITRLKQEDKTLYLAISALRRIKGDRPEPFAREILGFLHSRHTDDYLLRYIERCRHLNELQAAFEASGRYPVSTYSEVTPIDDDTYRLALLLSFLTTHHRFEILQWLIEFLQSGAPAEAPQTILSIGFGTGYEIKLIQDCCPGWEILAFDNAAASHSYATALLHYFGRDPGCLQMETFPLETDAGIEMHLERFARIVVCEVLEHLESPANALRNLRRVLHPKGQMYLTMAVNLAQEDHIFLYSNIQQARDQVSAADLRIIREWATPVTISPFIHSADREDIRKGNYVCVVTRT